MLLENLIPCYIYGGRNISKTDNMLVLSPTVTNSIKTLGLLGMSCICMCPCVYMYACTCMCVHMEDHLRCHGWGPSLLSLVGFFFFWARSLAWDLPPKLSWQCSQHQECAGLCLPSNGVRFLSSCLAWLTQVLGMELSASYKKQASYGKGSLPKLTPILLLKF